MAHLIKTSLRPHNWLLKKEARLIPINQLISAQVKNKNDEMLAHIDHEKLAIKKSIGDFLSQKQNYVALATERSIRKYRSRLALETIISFATWRHNCQKEALAISAIARKIACNITNVSDLAQETSIDGLKQKLENCLQQRLYVPEHLVDMISEKYHHLSVTLGHPHYFFPHQHEAARLTMTAIDSSFHLDFHAADINTILNAVQTWLLDRFELVTR